MSAKFAKSKSSLSLSTYREFRISSIDLSTNSTDSTFHFASMRQQKRLHKLRANDLTWPFGKTGKVAYVM